MEVTKQRDLDSDIRIRFRLMPIRIGMDARGIEITTTVTDAEPEPLTHDTAAVAAKIEGALRARGSEDIAGQTFRTRDAVAWVRGEALSKAKAPRDLLNRVNRSLLEMLKKGSVEKLKRGQCVWRNAHEAQKCSTQPVM
jgi:hypothetical protein